MKTPPVQKEAADQVHPVAESIQPREGDIARAQHQRAPDRSPIPSITGTANRNIMVVPCMVKIWL